MDHQDLYNKLKFDSFTRFEDFLHYIQTELVQFIVSKYLEELNINKNKEINYKNFLSLLTIYYFKEEFNLNDDDFLKIKDFVNSFNDIEKRKFIFIHNWDITEKIVTKIIDDNKNSLTEEYVKIVFNLTNLLNDISEDDSKTQLEQTKNYYRELLTHIKGDKTDEYIQTISSKLENNSTYDDFRKNVFFDKLEKELNTTQEQEPKYDAILYLLSTIKNKLCNLTPNRKDLKNYIN